MLTEMQSKFANIAVEGYQERDFDEDGLFSPLK
jgi:hypothetical protein